MSGMWGKRIQLSIFGESHGSVIGMVIHGLPAGLRVDAEAIAADMARRAPGGHLTSPRREIDAVDIVSGVLQGYTTGAPVCGMIRNTNVRSGDYSSLRNMPRPGHADYAGHVKYNGFEDIRGGGHFSGRLTAPLVFAGALVRPWLSAHGVVVGAHIASIGGIMDHNWDGAFVNEDALNALRTMRWPLLDADSEKTMQKAVLDAAAQGDSVGGEVECAAVGMPAGVGEPFFQSVESVLSGLLFSIPGVKGVSFGTGFGLASMRGSEANDAFCIRDGRVSTVTNHNGGLNGGITNGMPVIVRVAIKPTPSISKRQQTVNLQTMQEEPISIQGRHDPCIVPRAVPVVEAAVMLGLADLMMEGNV